MHIILHKLLLFLDYLLHFLQFHDDYISLFLYLSLFMNYDVVLMGHKYKHGSNVMSYYSIFII
jgi:hypothetical protein